MNYPTISKIAISCVLLFALMPFARLCGETNPELSLEAEFRAPPSAAKPSAFWPWIGGHITREGIRADLEAMQASNMRGGIIFDLSLYIPEGDVAYGSSEWEGLVDYAITTGHKMGLEIGFQNCAGWATSGGPSVTPEDSMKRMVFSETKVDATRPGLIRLAMPDNIREDFYRDVAILALPEKFKADEARVDFEGADVSNLQSADAKGAVAVRSEEPAVFLFAYEEPTTLSSWGMDIIGNAAGSFNVTIEVSGDGNVFEKVAEFMAGGRLRGRTPLTQSFDPVTGQIFRVTLIAPLNRGNTVRFQVARMQLLPDPRIPNFALISLGAASAARQFHPSRMPSMDTQYAIEPETILDLTDRLADGGILDWKPDSGRWTVLRFGYTSTGAKNHPAREGGYGLEVDKMDAAAVKRFFDAALVPVFNRNPGKIAVIGIDSWEAGLSNWTSDFEYEFKARRGYNIRPFLPVLTGRIVISPAQSYAFLQDFRVVITDLIAENYHRIMQEEANRHGAKLFLEPYPGWNMDEFKSSRYADLVASEFWIHDIGDFGTVMGNVRRTSAMVETIKKDKRLSAEAFTGRPDDAAWRASPRSMKRVADSALINGVNDFTFHSFVHQPHDNMRPGFTHGRYGTEFGRHNTWWPFASAFSDYLARCGFLLRQGNRVADYLFLKNEGTFMDDRFPDVPAGYEFLFVAPFTLLESEGSSGSIITPGGGSHPMLVVPAIWVADLPLVEKLLEFKEAGVAILGGRPVMPAGRNDLQQMEKWNRVVAEIFPDTARAATTGQLALAAREKGIIPDFSFSPESAPLEYAHRKLHDLDIYFIRNAGLDPVSVSAQFRVSVGYAQYWDPLDGSMHPAQAVSSGEQGTAVAIDLPPLGSIFVIFGLEENPAPSPVAYEEAAEIRIDDWRVSFQAPTGDSFDKNFNTLKLWNESQDNRVKYFSGKGIYSAVVELPAVAVADRVKLDLGKVYEMARVKVNGQIAGITWTAPDSLDVTTLIREGANKIEIEVVNTWVNRLVGDELLPDEAEYEGIAYNAGIRAGVLTKFPAWYKDPAKMGSRQRTTFAAWRHYNEDSQLVSAGLAGPVIIRVLSPR
jgi:hypothetical protein